MMSSCLDLCFREESGKRARDMPEGGMMLLSCCHPEGCVCGSSL